MSFIPENASEHDALTALGEAAEDMASHIPAGLSPFHVVGEDPISLAIASRAREVEDGLNDSLLALKADMTALAFEIKNEAGYW